MAVAKRGRLVETDIREAKALAKSGSPGDRSETVWSDTEAKGLRLRVRGSTATWLHKTEVSNRVIGDVFEMSLSEARDLVYKHRGNKTIPARTLAARLGWTVKDCFERYSTSLSQTRQVGRRIRHGKAASEADARSVLFKAQCKDLHRRMLADLTIDDLLQARDKISAESTPGQGAKFVTYCRAALNYALNEGGTETGLGGGIAWWMALKPPMIILSKDQVDEIENEEIEPLSPIEVGYVLARHEAYCRGKDNLAGQHQVTPGVRYGLWLLCMVAQRKHMVVNLLRSNLREEPLLPEGYMLARWPASLMKASKEHALPLSPICVEICERAMAGADAARLRQSDEVSKWVFPSSASRRRKTLALDDMHVREDAISNHLARMRGKRNGDENHLAGVREFGLHELRHGLASWISDVGMELSGASAVLAHTVAGDTSNEKVGKTTSRVYLQAQRIQPKLVTLDAWQRAVLEAYVEAGGSEFADFVKIAEAA